MYKADKYIRAATFLANTYPTYMKRHDEIVKNTKHGILESDELAYIRWKIGLIEIASKERFNDMERPIFRLVYQKRLTFREIKEIYYRKTGKKMMNIQIVKAKRGIVRSIAIEIQFSDTYYEEQGFTCLLFEEAEDWLEDPVNLSKIPNVLVEEQWQKKKRRNDQIFPNSR